MRYLCDDDVPDSSHMGLFPRWQGLSIKLFFACVIYNAIIVDYAGPK